jgi:hypothetical protein
MILREHLASIWVSSLMAPLYICDRPQRGLCSQKAAARSRCYWDVVWGLEHKTQWKQDSGHLLFSQTKASWGTSYAEWTEYPPFFYHVQHRGVIFDKSITRRLHTEMTEAKTFRTFIRIYSLFKSERLSANIKLILHKTLTRSVMT